MATYFSRNATDVQSADSMQTLYLMNSSYFGFPENALPGNVVLINQHAGYQFPGGHQQFMGIPLPAPSAHSFMGNQMSDMNVGFMSSNLMHNNPQWRNARGELSFVQPIGQASPTATNSTGSRCQIPAIENSSGGHHPIPEILQQHGQSRQGGLSLSLSYTSPGFMAASNSLPSDAITAAIVAPGGEGLAVKSDGGGNDEGKVKWEGGLQSVLLGSKYLKAAQELLDEVVNGGKGLKVEISTGKLPERDEKSKREWAPTSSEYPPATKKGGELTATERQELQMKKAKLITMLDEVNRRYKQYRHRMQAAVSSFEDAVGAGAAKTYTELALKTISKQFWCLCDAISGQIRLTSRNLGEEVDCYIIGSGKVEGSSLPQSVNRQQLTQQRPMHQPNAWRPRRGLPERAVSVLRAWLFEHFLHPYPKDADKEMLAKQTGLTRGQVSNWFINARVRLWKPMVEAMYMEETKAQENENNSDDKTCNLSEINEADAAAAMKPTETDSPGQKMNKTNSNQMEYTPTEPLASPPSISAATTAMSSLGDLRRSADGSGLIGSSSPDAHCLDNESVLKQATAKRIAGNNVQLQDLAPFPTTVHDDVKPDPGMNFVGMIGIGDRQNEHGLAFSNGFRS